MYSMSALPFHSDIIWLKLYLIVHTLINHAFIMLLQIKVTPQTTVVCYPFSLGSELRSYCYGGLVLCSSSKSIAPYQLLSCGDRIYMTLDLVQNKILLLFLESCEQFYPIWCSGLRSGGSCKVTNLAVDVAFEFYFFVM